MKSNPALQFTGIFTRVFACLILVTAAPALDVNHDGMDDLWQARYNIAPFAGALDPDGDGRINLVEAINMSDPVSTALPDAGLGSVYIRDLDPVDGLDDHWQARFGITAAQALEDPDEDGRTNLEEGIVASDPFVADQPWSGAGQNPGGGAAGGPQEWVLTIPVTVPGWRYTLQSSDTLMQHEWSTAAVASGQNAVHWGGGGALSITAATGGAERKFFRWFIDSPDTDGDGLGDWAEMQLGTGVMSIDTDGDGFSDSVEWGGGFHPVSAAHSPESVLSNGGIWLEHAAADTWDHVRWNKQAGPPVKYQTVADYGPDGDYDSSPWTESVPVMPAPQGLLPPEALSFGAWSAQWNQGGDFYEQPLYSYQVEQDMSPVPGAGSPYGGGRNSGARHAKFRLVTDYPRVTTTRATVYLAVTKWNASYSPGLWQGTLAEQDVPVFQNLLLPAGTSIGPALLAQLPAENGVAREASVKSIVRLKVGPGIPGGKVDSVLEGGDEHFVTPKWAADIDGENHKKIPVQVSGVSAAEIRPWQINGQGQPLLDGNNQPVPSPDQKIEWVWSPSEAAQIDTSDPTLLLVDRQAARHIEIQVRPKNQPAAPAAKLHVWVVWCGMTAKNTRMDYSEIGGVDLGIWSSRQPGFNAYMPAAGIEWIATIEPAELITGVEIPDLEQQLRFPPPGSKKRGVPDLGDEDATGSGFTSWDVSRQIRMRAFKGANLNAIGASDADDPSGYHAPQDYPENTVEGNDDSDSKDEDDNPYDDSEPGAEIGKLKSFDYPSQLVADNRRAPKGPANSGENGDRLHVYLNFREFVRLMIGGKWHRVSDHHHWRHHYKIMRQNGEWNKEPGTEEVFDLLPDVNP